MHLLINALLGLRTTDGASLDFLESYLAGLSIAESSPEQLLHKYRKTPATADLHDPSEDFTTYQQIFWYSALSALSSQPSGRWLDELKTFSSAADKLWKAAALFRLVAFLSYAESYLAQSGALERAVWNGDFSNLFFRHIYLYEMLAQGPQEHALHPWSHLRHHGRNYVRHFGTEEQVNSLRHGRVANLFRGGLLQEVGEAALNPDLASSYATFFCACIKAHNRELKTPSAMDASASGQWSPAILKRRLLAELGAEQFDHDILHRVFGMIGW